jgi:hypothetical protein
MESDRQKVMLAIGVGSAVILGVIAAFLFMGRGHKPTEAPAASQGGLQVSVAETPALDAKKKLRCFKDGAPVGEYTLAECAKMNGVAAQALDVGLDDNGNLAAAPTASLAPPPALPPAAVVPSGQTPNAPDAHTSAQPAQTASAPAEARGAACLRFGGADWRQVSDGGNLNSCVQFLFAGRCVRPGEAQYGRYGSATLRLVPGKVEISSDNAHFHTLVEQRRGCEVPQVH